jgi:hypothetical protein
VTNSQFPSPSQPSITDEEAEGRVIEPLYDDMSIYYKDAYCQDPACFICTSQTRVYKTYLTKYKNRFQHNDILTWNHYIINMI